MIAPESARLSGLPVASEFRIDRVKQAIDVQPNTRHNMLNVQKVFGFEISYENKAPPIGAPNATLTPAEAPAAIIYLLWRSFWITLKFLKGR